MGVGRFDTQPGRRRHGCGGRLAVRQARNYANVCSNNKKAARSINIPAEERVCLAPSAARMLMAHVSEQRRRPFGAL